MAFIEGCVVTKSDFSDTEFEQLRARLKQYPERFLGCVVKNLTVLLAGLLLAGCASSPETVSATGVAGEPVTMASAESKTESTDDGDQMICRNEKKLGSSLPQRVCLTKSQREEISRINQSDMANKVRTPSSQPRLN